jgi:hypothetical protein
LFSQIYNNRPRTLSATLILRKLEGRSMPIPDDADILIARLAGPLEPAARAAFRRAAQEALAQVPCAGEGAIYRAIAPLQRVYFDPPTDCRAHWDIEHELFRASKLKAGPPIEHVRYRKQER